MSLRVNDFYLPSARSVEKTPSFILLAGAISVIAGLFLFSDISWGFCGGGLLAMGLSRLSPHRFSTRIILAIVAMTAFCVAAVASYAFFKNALMDGQTAAILALAAGSIGTLALMQRKALKTTLIASFILAVIGTLSLFTNALLPFETAKALIGLSGAVFLSSAALIALKHKKEDILQALKEAENLEVDEPFAYAAFHEWLLKQNWDLSSLAGKKVIYTGCGVSFPFHPPEKIVGETTLSEDPSGFALAFAQSHGQPVKKCEENTALYLKNGDRILTLKAGDKMVGGAFYRRLANGVIYLHTLSRVAHLSGGKILKKVIDRLKNEGPLFIQVYEDNPALALYQKEGFSILSREYNRNGPFYNLILRP